MTENSWHFPEETVSFLNELAANNNRDWFSENKATYQETYVEPAKFFTNLMAETLSETFGENYTPKLFRIYRDVRFSKDKTPYNTHLHISFTPSGHKSTAWYFGLQADELVLGCGTFGFSPEKLSHYRDTILTKSGSTFVRTLENLKKDSFRISPPSLKRVPKGYDAEHPNAEYLKYKGMGIWRDFPDTAPATSGDLPALCVQTFKKMQPAFKWLQSI